MTLPPLVTQAISAFNDNALRNGIAILITDHQVRETLQITDRSYVIREGRVLCHGEPQEVIRNPEARKYYFGEGMDIRLPGDDDRQGAWSGEMPYHVQESLPESYPPGPHRPPAEPERARGLFRRRWRTDR